MRPVLKGSGPWKRVRRRQEGRKDQTERRQSARRSMMWIDRARSQTSRKAVGSNDSFKELDQPAERTNQSLVSSHQGSKVRIADQRKA
jgi:hypothetical protein